MILCVCPNPAIDKFVTVATLKKGKVNRADNEQSFPGGKGVHVALGIKELGEDVAILAFWGGSTGQWIKEQCEAKGIACYGPDVEGWTRTCITLKSEDEFNETELLGKGPTIGAKNHADFLKNYEQLIEKSEMVCMSGSWPQSTVKVDYAQLILKASAFNKKAFIDCSGNMLLSALDKAPYGVHINHHEGYDLYKTTNPIELLHKVGVSSKIVAITCGAKGLYLSDGTKVVHALSKIEKVISAVGSGDSLMAGLVVACQRRYNLVETAKLAASCGAANCIREELGMFYKKEVEQLQKRCSINFV